MQNIRFSVSDFLLFRLKIVDNIFIVFNRFLKKFECHLDLPSAMSRITFMISHMRGGIKAGKWES